MTWDERGPVLGTQGGSVWALEDGQWAELAHDLPPVLSVELAHRLSRGSDPSPGDSRARGRRPLRVRDAGDHAASGAAASCRSRAFSSTRPAALRQLVNVYVDGRDARDELESPLAADAVVRVVAAVAGGSRSTPSTGGVVCSAA